MAWFRQALQTSGQPDASTMPDFSLAPDSIHTPPRMSAEHVCSGQTTLSIRDFPTVSGMAVPPRLEEISCMPSITSSAEDPAPLSYVTLQEQRCVLSWFLGWNGVQKERFLEDLISKAVPGKVSSLLDQLNTLQVNDRPPNIFECQLRLWSQWFDSWSEEERNGFLSSLEEKDSGFVAYFYKRVEGTAGKD